MSTYSWCLDPNNYHLRLYLSVFLENRERRIYCCGNVSNKSKLEALILEWFSLISLGSKWGGREPFKGVHYYELFFICMFSTIIAGNNINIIISWNIKWIFFNSFKMSKPGKVNKINLKNLIFEVMNTFFKLHSTQAVTFVLLEIFVQK